MKRFIAQFVCVIKVLKSIASAGGRTKCKYFLIEHSHQHGFSKLFFAVGSFFQTEKNMKTFGTNTGATHAHTNWVMY